MHIVLTCPNCGNSTWITQDAEGAFECGACGDYHFPEDMSAEVKEDDTNSRAMGNGMRKSEFLDAFDNGITVGGLIRRLESLPKGKIVVNDCRNNEPVTDIHATTIHYCLGNSIITKNVVQIY